MVVMLERSVMECVSKVAVLCNHAALTLRLTGTACSYLQSNNARIDNQQIRRQNVNLASPCLLTSIRSKWSAW